MATLKRPNEYEFIPIKENLDLNPSKKICLNNNQNKNFEFKELDMSLLRINSTITAKSLIEKNNFEEFKSLINKLEFFVDMNECFEKCIINQRLNIAKWIFDKFNDIYVDKCLYYSILNQNKEICKFILDIYDNHYLDDDFEKFEDLYDIMSEIQDLEYEKNFIKRNNILGFVIQDFPCNIDFVINSCIVEYFSIDTIKYIFDELDYKLNPEEIDIECNGIKFDGIENNFFDFLFFFQKTDLIKYFYQKGILDFKKYNIDKGYQLFKRLKEPNSEEKILIEMWRKFVLDN